MDSDGELIKVKKTRKIGAGMQKQNIRQNVSVFSNLWLFKCPSKRAYILLLLATAASMEASKLQVRDAPHYLADLLSVCHLLSWPTGRSEEQSYNVRSPAEEIPYREENNGFTNKPPS